MLTALPGAAITSIKISGVSHEFSTIKGITEDVSDIILNLKKVRFKMKEDEVVLIGDEFWDLLGGKGTFLSLIELQSQPHQII